MTTDAPPTERGRPFLLTGEGWPYLLVPLIPVAVVLEFMHAGAVSVFFASALGVIPTAALMGRATEELAARSGPGIGALLNVTFGNAPELIIALFALGAGLQEVVKASLVGSILGNILLVLGMSMLAGGLRRERQNFELRAATAQSLMLLLATVALVMPAIFQLVAGGGLPEPRARAVEFSTDLKALSVGVALVLLASYAAGLVFSLKTHAHLFNPSRDEPDHGGEPWSVRKSVLMLAIAGAAVGWMSEILVHSITEASEAIGLSPFFVGIIVVAVVGNAAEHWVAVYFAARDRMDISINIAVGSAAQIALFVAPVLVLASFAIGPFPMALVFNGFEIGAIFLAIIIANEVIQRDGTFSVVPQMKGGVTNPWQLRRIADVADKYAIPMIKLTGGQRIDLLGVRKEDLPAVWADLDMPSGYAYGKSFRTVKTCVGSDFCRYGLGDSTALGIALEERYQGLASPAKMKLAVTGCPRNCAEALCKDLGVVAVGDGRWEIYVGGAAGAHIRKGDLLATVDDPDTVITLTGRFLQYYRENANWLERTYAYVPRVGIERIRAVVVDDADGIAAELDARMQKSVDAYRDPWQDGREPVTEGQFRTSLPLLPLPQVPVR